MTAAIESTTADVRTFQTAAGSSVTIKPGVSHAITGVFKGLDGWIHRNVNDADVEAMVTQMEAAGRVTNIAAFPERF